MSLSRVKKLTFSLIFTLALCVAAASNAVTVHAQVTGANKFGLNVAAKSNHVSMGVGNFVNQGGQQSGGWIVFIPEGVDSDMPGNAADTATMIEGSYFTFLGGNVNYIMRGHRMENNWTDNMGAWSSFWADVLHRIENKIPAGSEFYFMPLNEPNLPGECNNKGTHENTNCAPLVKSYVTQLRAKYSFGGKIKMLSPSYDVSAPNFDAFYQALGGAGYVDQFDGVAVNYYDFETHCNGQAFCDADFRRNPGKMDELLNFMGTSKNLFIVEIGLVGTSCPSGWPYPECPNFKQPDITKMLCALNNLHGQNSKLAMFSPLTYDPEDGDREWFWETTETQDYYMSRSSDCSNFGVSRPSRLEPLIGRDPYDRLLLRKNPIGPTPAPQSRYTKMAWCPAMSNVNAGDVVKSLSAEDYKYCLQDASRIGMPNNLNTFISCPDYSPNRPYPGDTCLDFADVQSKNKTTFKMPDLVLGGAVTYTLCSKSRERDLITGLYSMVVHCVPQTHSVTVRESVDVKFGADSFVEYLGTGNEYTANPNAIMSLKNNISRTSQYLTDYLRGFFGAPGVAERSDEAYWFYNALRNYEMAINGIAETDPQRSEKIAAAQKVLDAALAKIPNLKERLHLTAGVIPKIYPWLYRKNNSDSNKVLLERWLKANADRTSGDRPKDSIDRTPIGDYVIGYSCDGEFAVNEEDFIDSAGKPDSLDRRYAFAPKDGKQLTKKCGSVYPVRISDFICGNDSADWFGMDRNQICRGKTSTSNEGTPQEILWPYFFPVMTREDTPVRLRRVCDSNSAPFDKNKYPEHTFTNTKEEEEFLRSSNVDSYYYQVSGPTAPTAPGAKKFKIVNRTYVYIGHLAEARELAYMTQKALFPASFNEKVGDWTKFSPEKAAGDYNSGTVAKKGDLVAQDSILRIDANRNQVPATLEKTVVLDEAPTWSGSGSPPQHTVNFSDNYKCEITAEMPFIEELATRTIGKDAGFMRLFLPEAVGAELDKQAEADNDGASIAKANYKVSGDIILPAEADLISGSSVGDQEGKLPVPFVRKMALFQKIALGYGLNPAKVQAGRDVIVPGTGETASSLPNNMCPAQTMTIPSSLNWTINWNAAAMVAVDLAAQNAGHANDASYKTALRKTIDAVKYQESSLGEVTTCNSWGACGTCQMKQNFFTSVAAQMKKSDVYKNETFDNVLDYTQCAKVMAYFFAAKNCVPGTISEADFKTCFMKNDGKYTARNVCESQAQGVWDYAH